MFFWLALLLVFCHYPSPARAAENLFNSGAAIKEEASRLAEEGKLFVKAPVDPYLAESAAVAGLFALSYLYDQDIRSDLRGVHNGTLTTATDIASAAGNPLLHIGVAAALYTSGVVADSPKLSTLGTEIGEALVLADGATFVLREAVGRQRPQDGNGSSTYRPFQFKKDYDSLPSMHTASSFALAHVIASKSDNPAVKVLCYAGAGFVGFSRLYQGKHWASDVVLGAAIGELAGNSVTRYYSLFKSGLTVAPVSIAGAPALAVTGKF